MREYQIDKRTLTLSRALSFFLFVIFVDRNYVQGNLVFSSRFLYDVRNMVIKMKITILSCCSPTNFFKSRNKTDLLDNYKNIIV